MGESNPTYYHNPTYDHLDKFTLFETPSNFYLIGRDKGGKHWRVLKISRSEPSELVIYEDPTIYSHSECNDLLRCLNEVHKLKGGLKFVTQCYGIVGFIKLLGPYYMILVSERREIGNICGHPIYGISEYKMIPIPHSTVWSFLDNNFGKESRYKQLLCSVDITKDFFFSYSYPIMHRLQRNLSQQEVGQSSEATQTSDGTMFVWNDYLTRQIRDHLKNTLWTVALVHGFFKQVELSNSMGTFIIILIARRSCQFAGTRYQKRGVNGEGQVANHVEIEQIVCKHVPGGHKIRYTSSVQNRGSIPLHWYQKPSWFNFKPAILFSESIKNYLATKLHLQNLRQEFGDPIILLSLVKKCEKKGRESLLHVELDNAVDCINASTGDHVKFWPVDLDHVFREKGTRVLADLKGYAVRALNEIGFFSCQVHQSVTFSPSFDLSYIRINSNCDCTKEMNCSNSNNKHQKGILRTNCLDSLDRTNVAQYVYGLVALHQQLVDLQIAESSEVIFSDPLAYDVMSLYEAMGDALAQQYGGSAAHSKIFSKIRGKCEAVIKMKEFLTTVQRHYSNSFKDVDKQTAIDIFLGHFQPEVYEASLLETESENRSMLQRSQSDSTIHYDSMCDITSSSQIANYQRASSNFRSVPSMPSVGELLFDFESQWFGSLQSCVHEDADEFGSLYQNDSTGLS